MNNEYKWYRFPIIRERQYFRFTNIPSGAPPIQYEIFQLPDPNCPNLSSGEEIGSGAITAPDEQSAEPFTVGPDYGYIKFTASGSVTFKFAVMYGDPEGEGSDNYSGGNVPTIVNCGSGMSTASTLAMNPDPEVEAYLGSPAPIGVWFKYETPGGQYVSLTTDYPSGDHAPQIMTIVNVIDGTPPAIVSPSFEEGALCTWSGGYAPGNYFVYIYTDAGEAPGFVNLCLNLNPVPNPASNDAFDDAYPITPSDYGSCNYIHAAIPSATRSPYPEDNVCTSGLYDNSFHYGEDVWYSFTATQSDYYFIINNITDLDGNLRTINMSVWNADGSSAVGSSCKQFFPMGGTEAVSVITDLNPGSNYKLRLGGWSIENYNCANTSCEFDFCLARPNCITNDRCADAIPFTPPQPGQSTSIVSSTHCADFIGIGECNTSGEKSAWWSFTATQNSYEITLNAFNDVINDAHMRIDVEFMSDCNGATVPGSCETILLNQTKSMGSLTLGQTYYLRISTGLNDAAFSLLISAPELAAIDDCNSTAVFPVSEQCNFTQVSTENASLSAEGSCGFGNNDDVWYNFTATTRVISFTATNIVATQGNAGSIYFGIYESCSGALKACFALGASNSQVVSNLDLGQSYKLQMFMSGANNRGTFDVCLQAIPAVTNDECANAVLITPQVYNTANPIPFAVNTLGAASGPDDCDLNSVDDELWYRFTASSDSYLFKLSNFTVNTGTPGSETVKIEFFETCGGASAGCYALTTYLGRVVALTSGQTYRYRVWTEEAGIGASFDLLQLRLPNKPANDYCDTPVPVTVSAFDSPCNPLSGSTLGGTYSSDYEC